MKQAVIGNGVNTRIFYPGKEKSSKMFTLLYVWRLDPGKNLTILLDAFHLLDKQHKLDKNIRCILVWWWVMEMKYKKIVESYTLWNNVEFTGRIQAESPRLVQLYQEASVFVLPSLYETEWMVVLEAMACGCPLLIADSPTSAAKDFVQNNGYTFNCKDPQDLADKIYFLYTHPDVVQAMTQISAKNAQEFSFTLSIQKLESFFLSLVHHK